MTPPGEKHLIALNNCFKKMAGGGNFRCVFTKLPHTYCPAMKIFLFFLQRININSKD